MLQRSVVGKHDFAPWGVSRLLQESVFGYSCGCFGLYIVVEIICSFFQNLLGYYVV